MIVLAQLDDLTATLVRHAPLQPDDLLSVHLTLVFRDLPTGETAEMSFSSEQEAIMTFAAWLACDEEGHLGPLEPYRQALYQQFGTGKSKFLP